MERPGRGFQLGERRVKGTEGKLRPGGAGTTESGASLGLLSDGCSFHSIRPSPGEGDRASGLNNYLGN